TLGGGGARVVDRSVDGVAALAQLGRGVIGVDIVRKAAASGIARVGRDGRTVRPVDEVLDHLGAGRLRAHAGQRPGHGPEAGDLVLLVVVVEARVGVGGERGAAPTII